MKILIISDTHLDFPIEQSKLDFLKKIISQADQVIINGDFWEGQEVRFNWFINSRWSELFPLLLKRKTIYLYGNHDMRKMTDDRVKLFSVEQHLRYRLKLKDKVLVIEHGNRLCPFVDEDPWKILTPTGFAMKFIIAHIEKRIIHTLGPKFVTRSCVRYNKIIKKKLKKELKPNEIYVCGHTHAAEFSPEQQFINSGFMKYGIAQYIWIENNTITLKEGYYD